MPKPAWRGAGMPPTVASTPPTVASVPLTVASMPLTAGSHLVSGMPALTAWAWHPTPCTPDVVCRRMPYPNTIHASPRKMHRTMSATTTAIRKADHPIGSWVVNVTMPALGTRRTTAVATAAKSVLSGLYGALWGTFLMYASSTSALAKGERKGLERLCWLRRLPTFAPSRISTLPKRRRIGSPSERLSSSAWRYLPSSIGHGSGAPKDASKIANCPGLTPRRL